MNHSSSERFAYEITGILLRFNFEYLKDLVLPHGKNIKNSKVKTFYEYVLITRINVMRVICESWLNAKQCIYFWYVTLERELQPR